MKTLLTRSISGLIFVSLVVLCLIWDERLMLALFGLISGIGLYEYHQLFTSKHRLNYSPAISAVYGTISFFILIFPWAYEDETGLNGFYHSGIHLIILISCYGVFQLIIKRKHFISNLSLVFMGACYIIIPLYIGATIHLSERGGTPLLLGVFLLVWTNDTFAYITGNLFGKHKLLEKISPNKTWEGFIGGLAFTVLAGYFFDLFLQNDSIVQGTSFWMISALIIAPAAVLGDLFESALKRKQNVKDTGNIMPGHGGILDRFDAVLFAIPFFYLWEMIYQYFIHI